MNAYDLLVRMKNRDPGAFLEFSDKYSWSLYSAIREKFPDSETASKIYSEAINGFYRSLNEWEGDDPLEALLLEYANGVCCKNGLPGLQGDAPVGQRAPVDAGMPDLVPQQEDRHPAENSSKTEKKSGGFLYRMVALLLTAGIAAAIWVIVGILMDIGVVPEYDLGYSWFNANIAQWFLR